VGHSRWTASWPTFLPATENSPLFEIGRVLARRWLIDHFEVMVFHDLRRIAHFKRDLSLVFDLLHPVAAK